VTADASGTCHTVPVSRPYRWAYAVLMGLSWGRISCATHRLGIRSCAAGRPRSASGREIAHPRARSAHNGRAAAILIAQGPAR
jgi:hypothetical protein